MLDDIKIQIFIASFNRPIYLKEAIHSVLNQTAMSLIEIIVSDNSTNDDVQMMMEKDYSSVKYIKRQPSLPVDEHFKAIIGDVTSDFYMIFHDDDIMHSQLVENLYNKLLNDLNLVAIGANGWYYFEEKKIIPTIYFSLFKKTHFKNPVSFVQKYLIGLGVAPFSGYMYRSSVYNKSFINFDDGGKYSDLTFLLKGFDFGSLLWLNTPMMYYRIHNNNDSGQVSFSDRDKLIKFLTEKIQLQKNSLLIKLYQMHDYNVLFKQYITQYSAKSDLSQAIIFIHAGKHNLNNSTNDHPKIKEQ